MYNKAVRHHFRLWSSMEWITKRNLKGFYEAATHPPTPPGRRRARWETAAAPPPGTWRSCPRRAPGAPLCTWLPWGPWAESPRTRTRWRRARWPWRARAPISSKSTTTTTRVPLASSGCSCSAAVIVDSSRLSTGWCSHLMSRHSDPQSELAKQQAVGVGCAPGREGARWKAM